MKKYILAITGASGSIFGIRLLEELLKAAEVHVVISHNAFSIIDAETGIDWTIERQKTEDRRQKTEDGRRKTEKTEDIIRKYFKTERQWG